MVTLDDLTPTAREIASALQIINGELFIVAPACEPEPLSKWLALQKEVRGRLIADMLNGVDLPGFTEVMLAENREHMRRVFAQQDADTQAAIEYVRMRDNG